MNRAKTVGTLYLASVALAAFFWGLKIRADMAAGAPLLWLAEGWGPAATLTILTVVAIDVAVPPPARPLPKPAAGKPRRRARRVYP